MKILSDMIQLTKTNDQPFWTPGPEVGKGKFLIILDNELYHNQPEDGAFNKEKVEELISLLKKTHQRKLCSIKKK